MPTTSKEELLQELCRRLMAGELPKAEPPPSLPESKNGFPKLLCLDSNIWIELAKADLGKNCVAGANDALMAIRNATARGSLLVPLAGMNVGEAAQSRNEGARERLITSMVSLSGNLSLRNENAVASDEFEGAIAHLLLKRPKPPPLRPRLIQRGVDSAITGAQFAFSVPGLPLLGPILDRIRLQPEVTVWMMNQLISDELRATQRQSDLDFIPKLEAVREASAGLTPATRLAQELGNLVTGPMFASVAGRLGLRTEDILAWLGRPGNAEALLSLMPETDVSLGLLMAHSKNPRLLYKPGDYRDIVFFQLAVAYANVVIGEKLWSDMAERSGVAARHRTHLLVASRLADLPELLRAEGCD